MNSADFTAGMPGELVPTTEGALAFVPAPAPRVLSLDPEGQVLLAEADHQLGCLSGAAPRGVNPYLVGSSLLRREAIVSSRIEGTYTTPQQLVLLEAGQKLPDASEQGVNDTQEVVNYIRAMHAGIALLQTLPLANRVIKEMHRILLRGVRGEDKRPGEWRTAQVWIGPRDSPIVRARFVPPPPNRIDDLIADLERLIQGDEATLPLLVRAGLVHYQFETIHPFTDGNGRIGRGLIPLMLMERGRLRAPLLYLSEFFERHRDAYVDHLLAVSKTGDFRPWLAFFLRAIAESASDAFTQVHRLVELRESYREMVQTRRASALLPKLIDRLFEQPSITITEAAEILAVTPAAAGATIHKLVEMQILHEVTGRTKNQIFVANGIMRFMDREAQASP